MHSPIPASKPAPPLPAPTIEMLADMRRVAKFLDRIADTALSDELHCTARAHAITLWGAIDRVDELAHLVDDLAAVASAAVRRES